MSFQVIQGIFWVSLAQEKLAGETQKIPIISMRGRPSLELRDPDEEAACLAEDRKWPGSMGLARRRCQGLLWAAPQSHQMSPTVFQRMRHRAVLVPGLRVNQVNGWAPSQDEFNSHLAKDLLDSQNISSLEHRSLQPRELLTSCVIQSK